VKSPQGPICLVPSVGSHLRPQHLPDFSRNYCSKTQCAKDDTCSIPVPFSNLFPHCRSQGIASPSNGSGKTSPPSLTLSPSLCPILTSLPVWKLLRPPSISSAPQAHPLPAARTIRSRRKAGETFPSFFLSLAWSWQPVVEVKAGASHIPAQPLPSIARHLSICPSSARMFFLGALPHPFSLILSASSLSPPPWRLP
jgi:hypothetical protein